MIHLRKMMLEELQHSGIPDAGFDLASIDARQRAAFKPSNP